MYTPDKLLTNIIDNYTFLQEDFTGLSFNILGVTGVILNVLFSAFLILVFYLIGKRIERFFHGLDYMPIAIFVNISLGYIFCGTIIAILGTLSLLHPLIITVVIIFFLILAFYPINKFFYFIKGIFAVLLGWYLVMRTHKWIFFGVSFFVVISFLRLIPPEIGEDAIGYHTDLPFLYLQHQTTMLENKDLLKVIPAPQLGEMSYLIAEFFGIRDATRYIHFSFYVLLIILLFHISKMNGTRVFGFYAPIIFVTSSVIIRHSTKANVDFQALFCWILSVLIITNARKYWFSTIILSGVLLGGALSTKLWALAFIPVFVLYFIVTQKKKYLVLKSGVIFLLATFAVPLIWYVRSYLLTKNPFYPAFASSAYLGVNSLIFSSDNVFAFGPLFFLGVFFLFYNLKQNLIILKRSKVFLFFLIIAFEHLFIKYYLARYLLNLYSLAILVSSFGLDKFIQKIKIARYIASGLWLALFTYYFLNTLSILPYGFGWADKNKYLTRILSKDSSSYYDFDHLFGRHISTSDLVATYRLTGFYYANFDHIDVINVFDKGKSFDKLIGSGATKLIIFGGEIEWFCKELGIKGCEPEKYKLLASYSPGQRYLYSLVKNNSR